MTKTVKYSNTPIIHYFHLFNALSENARDITQADQAFQKLSAEYYAAPTAFNAQYALEASYQAIRSGGDLRQRGAQMIVSIAEIAIHHNDEKTIHILQDAGIGAVLKNGALDYRYG